MLKNILSNLDFASKKKLFILIISNFFIGILEMLSFGSIYVYLKFVLFDELIFKSHIIKLIPEFFEQTKIIQISIFSFMVFFLFLFKNTSLLLLIRLEAKISNQIFFNIKRRMSDILIGLPYELIFSRYSSDEIMNTFIIDTEKYKYTLTEFVKVSREFILIICLTLLITFQNYIVSLFAILFFIILTSIVLFYFKPITKKLGKRLRIIDGLLIKKSLNIFLSIKTIKIFKKENYFKKNLIDSLKEFEDINRIFYILKNIPRLFFELLTILLILILILYFTFNNNNINELVPLIALLTATFVRMMPSFASINSSLNAIKFNESSTKKLKENLDFLNQNKISIQNDNKKEVLNLNETGELNIDLKNIEFGFNSKLIFNNLNFTIPHNKFISIFGESGSGKSTLLNIISGLFTPSNGIVSVNGVNIFDDLGQWHSQVGYVDQETSILNDSILQNVAFGENNPDIDNFYNVLKKVKLYDYCMNLPDKEKTILTEFGQNLSGGQKQRIGIARALYKKSKILLLDEPTSALDEKNEIEIFQHLNELKKNLTVIMVTHKNKAREYSDKSFIIKNGQIKQI